MPATDPPTDAPGSPDVSVIIPCYNHARFLGEAIESCLAQTVGAPEIIVVDDGSTDDSAQVARRYTGVRVVSQPNAGLSAARNTGLDLASREFIVFLDADDRLLPDALKYGLRSLSEHPEAAFTSGGYRGISADGRPWTEVFYPLEESAYTTLLRGNYIGMHGTVMFRRSVLNSIGGYDTSLRAGEDYEIYLRLTWSFNVVQHTRIVAEYRRHGMNMSKDHAFMLRSVLFVLRKQKGRIGDDSIMRQAYYNGKMTWTRYYATLQLEEIAARVQKGELLSAIRGGIAIVQAGGIQVVGVLAFHVRNALVQRYRFHKCPRPTNPQ